MRRIAHNLEILIDDLAGRNKWTIVSGMIFIDIVLLFLLSISITYTQGDEVFDLEFLSGESLSSIFFLVVIFAPIFETFLFQLLIIETVLFVWRKLDLQNSMLFSVIISGFAFGISHAYNIYYISVTVFMGILYGLFYFVAKGHKELNPFLIVCIIHSISNLVGFVVDDWLGLM